MHVYIVKNHLDSLYYIFIHISSTVGFRGSDQFRKGLSHMFTFVYSEDYKWQNVNRWILLLQADAHLSDRAVLQFKAAGFRTAGAPKAYFGM